MRCVLPLNAKAQVDPAGNAISHDQALEVLRNAFGESTIVEEILTRNQTIPQIEALLGVIFPNSEGLRNSWIRGHLGGAKNLEELSDEALSKVFDNARGLARTKARDRGPR